MNKQLKNIQKLIEKPIFIKLPEVSDKDRLNIRKWVVAQYRRAMQENPIAKRRHKKCR